MQETTMFASCWGPAIETKTGVLRVETIAPLVLGDSPADLAPWQVDGLRATDAVRQCAAAALREGAGAGACDSESDTQPCGGQQLIQGLDIHVPGNTCVGQRESLTWHGMHGGANRGLREGSAVVTLR